MRLLPFREPAPLGGAIALAIQHLDAGGILAHPTETVYGFGCTLSERALAALARLKGRETGKPFLLLVSHANDAPGLEWNEAARRLASGFWPGPLTLALPAGLHDYPASVVSESGAVAIRVCAHPGLRKLLRALGRPMTSTSANPAGGTPARSADEVATVLGTVADRQDVLVLDAGPLHETVPSTVVDCTGEVPRVVRAGAIDVSRLRRVVREIDD